MKKRSTILIVLGTILILPLVALAAVPLLFRDRVVERVKAHANRALDARVDWRSASLALFGDFPNLTLGLDDVTIASTGRFAGDTLAAVRRLQVVLDLGSVLRSVRRGAPIIVRAIELDRPVVSLRVLEDGTANWRITQERPGGENRAGHPLAVSLRRLDIRDARLSLDNRHSGLVASLVGYRQTLTGDFSRDVFVIRTQAHGDTVSLRFGGIPYLNRVALEVTAAIDADTRAKRFTLGRNEIRLNDLRLGVTGSAAAAEDRVALDLTFSAPSTDFRHILSLVPAIYARDFRTLRTAGAVAVSGRITGDYGERAFPAFAVNVKVTDGSFQYPDLPLPARDIALDLAVTNPGGAVDSTVARFDRFHAVIGREPIDGALVLRTPVSDPDLDFRLAGSVDLADVRRTLKLGTSGLAGRIAADVAVRTRMSYVDERQYDRIAARGSVDVRDLTLGTADPRRAVAVDAASLRLTPQRAEVRSLAGRIGTSDLRLAGSVDNLVPFALRGDVLRGTATLSSTRFNLDEWRSDDSLQVIPVPANLDFALQATVGTLTYGALTMTDARGGLRVKDRRATLERFVTRTLGGEIGVSGWYETADLARPTFDVDLRMTDVDIPAAFVAFNTVRALAPVARYARGSVSTDLRLTGALGPDMVPLFDVLDGRGSLRTSQLVLQDLPVMSTLADALMLEQLRNPTLDGVRSSIQIRQGRVHVDPFDVRAGRSTMRVAGSHGIDQSLRYTLHLRVPRSELGADANRVVAGLVSRAGRTGVDLAAADTVALDVQLGGTVTNPAVSTSLGGVVASARQGAEQAARAEVARRVDSARERVDSAAEEARRRARAEAERLIAEAEERAAAVREEARRVAEGVKREGYTRADSLLERAGSPVARAAARPIADRLRREADARAEQIVREADKRADDLVAEARRKAGGTE